VIDAERCVLCKSSAFVPDFPGKLWHYIERA
jgi:hypothetical protein